MEAKTPLVLEDEVQQNYINYSKKVIDLFQDSKH